MKRFLIFGYDDFYPAGGLDDYVCDVDSIDELISHKEELDSYESLDILDFETRETIKNVDFSELLDFMLSML